MKLTKNALVAAVVAVPALSIAASAFAADNTAAEKAAARITMAQAEATAHHAFPGGKIVKKELEKERGGSGLRYSFDMKKGSHWKEVGVDAVTGKVLENTNERANPTD